MLYPARRERARAVPSLEAVVYSISLLTLCIFTIAKVSMPATPSGGL